ncbi:MAG TPA: ABC transporter substrate-binding protein, partial [Roseiarcus sp.]|nr:ABC transporter substrate-binding protein [Roseiarcus sp.]
MALSLTFLRCRYDGRRRRRQRRGLPSAALVLAAIVACAGHASADSLTIKVGVLRQTHSRETISIRDIPAADDFVAGAKLAMADNNTTGRFLDETFMIEDVKLAESDDAAAAAKTLLDSGIGFLIVDLPADALLKVAELARLKEALVFNAGAPDERLREEDCRANVIHTAPSRAMLADALAEYLIWKQWRKWLLVVGSHPDDVALGAAYERAAKKFGGKIVEKRTFEDTGGGRRSDSGVVQTQRQMPVFTQKAPDYDVLIAADENEVFGGYLPYRTWDPRPVAGSGGLMPTSWDPSHELWGAQQLQNRFERMFHRGMTARDNQAWVAMRMIGDAVARTKSADPKAARELMVSPAFEVAAFKGVKLTLRPWNLQLRQPILLTDGRGTVSVSPQ